MATEILKKFAEELKLTRESKNISLQQIANKIKADVKFLQAIEDANFEILPDLYIRAFIKEYAQAIDLNSKEILQKFDNALSGKVEEKPAEEPKVENKEILKSETKETAPKQTDKVFDSAEPQSAKIKTNSKPSIKLNYVIGGAILLVALIIVYFAFLNTHSPEIITENTNENVPRFEAEKPKPVQSESITQNPVVASVKSPDSLRISITTNDRVWVKVTSDGNIIQKSYVAANTKVNYAAVKYFSVSVGNAGAVKILLNNKPVENVGKPGELRNLYITPNSIRIITIPPQPKNEKVTPTKD